METYNTEELISSLLITGFNKVDQLLVTLVINKIKSDEKVNKELVFDNDVVSSNHFDEYVRFEDFTYFINGSSPMSVAYVTNNHKEVLIGDLLPVNKKLVNYLLSSDLKEVIIKKAKLVGISNLPIHADLFSNREINTIKEEYGKDAFGELYNADYKFKYDDFRNISDEELKNIMKDFTGSNYIYKYLLNDHQKQVAKNAMQLDKVNKDYYEKEDEIVNSIRTRENNTSLFLSVMDAVSRQ